MRNGRLLSSAALRQAKIAGSTKSSLPEIGL